MPIDPTLIARYLPQTQPIDVLGNQLRAAQLQNLNYNNQSQQLEIQQRQNELNKFNQLKELAAKNTNPDGTFNQEGYLNDLAKVAPLEAQAQRQKFALGDLEIQRAKSAQIAEAMKHFTDIWSYIDNKLSAVQSQDDYNRVLNEFSQSKIPGLAEEAQKAPRVYDPAFIEQKRREVIGAKNLAELHAKDLDRQANADKPTSDIGKINEDLKKGLISPSEAEAARRKATHVAPNMTQILLGGGQGSLTPEAKNLLVKKYLDTGVLDADIGRNPVLRAEIINAAAAQIKAANGEGGDLAGAKLRFKTRGEGIKYFSTGDGAKALRQQNTILHHAETFSKIADALNNGNIQLANKLGNQFGAQFGDDKASNYKIASQILSAEVGKYLAGAGGTGAEREELSKLIPSFSSPTQIKSGLKTLKNLVEGQKQSYLSQRKDILEGNIPFASDNGKSKPEIHVNPQTGERIQWNASTQSWEKVK